MGRKRQVGVRARGNSIQIDFRYYQQRCVETLRMRPTAANMKFASRMRESILHEIATGTFDYARYFPNSKRVARFGFRSQPTIKRLLTVWLNNKHQECAYSTYKAYNSAVTHHLIPRFGELLVSELTTADVRSWRNSLDVSPKMKNNILTPLRGILAEAFADGVIDQNPMDRIKNLSLETREPDPFSPDEVAAILAACRGQARNLFEFAFWTGLRTGELIALEWGDVDWRGGVVHVRRSSVAKQTKTTKTESGKRTVMLLPPAISALEAQQEHTRLQAAHVFHCPLTNAPWIDDQQIRKTAWKPTLRRAGVAYRPPYQTRHTYASMMLIAGETPMWVARQMGHANVGTTLRAYTRWIEGVGGSGGDKITAVWSQIGNKEQTSD